MQFPKKTKQQIEREKQKKEQSQQQLISSSLFSTILWIVSSFQYPPPILSSCTAVSSHATASLDICNPLATSNLPSNEAVRFCLTMLSSISLSSRVF